MTDNKLSFTFRVKGGPGSGHHGHRGRPGKRGGSLPGGKGSGKAGLPPRETDQERNIRSLISGALAINEDDPLTQAEVAREVTYRKRNDSILLHWNTPGGVKYASGITANQLKSPYADAKYGLTLDDIHEYLQQIGARTIGRRKRPPDVTSIYD